MNDAKTVALGIIVLLAAGLGGVLLYMHLSGRRPKEAALIENFYAHRSTFERVREMLEADQQLLRITRSGVETQLGVSHPPEGSFPIDRYNEYRRLLREVGAIGAYRGRGERTQGVSILVWASGWAADTTHVHIAWRQQPPPNQVPSLDE